MNEGSLEKMNDEPSAETLVSDAVGHTANDPYRSLFEQARRGDFTAFEKLVLELQPRVYQLVFRILRQSQDAEDVTQQTFLSLIEHIDQFRGDSAVATWVLRIATNHALKALRKRRTSGTNSMDPSDITDETGKPLPHPNYIAPWRETPADLAHRAAIRQIVDEALLELDEKYRIVFLLRDVEGLSIRETAETLGLTEANVKVRLLRARLQLRERLTQMFGDESERVIPDHSHADLAGK